jgi:hypothetical protein
MYNVDYLCQQWKSDILYLCSAHILRTALEQHNRSSESVVALLLGFVEEQMY